MSDDIVARLRGTRADMIGTADEQHYYDCHEAADCIERLRAELDAEREQLEKFRKLDVEAAKYCELPIIYRTKFTGEPPYVGWEGLGLAMREAFDERDTLRAALKKLAEGDYERPVDKIWRADGKPSKNDQCIHDRFLYEDCGNCAEDFARSSLKGDGDE